MWLIVITVLVIFLLLYKSMKKPHNFPPGPTGYPIVGNLFQVDHQFPNKTYEKWWTKYGDIFSVKFAKEDIVMVADPEAIKKAFSGNDFLDRPKTFLFLAFADNKNAGLTTAWGSRWVDHRRFTMRHLKDYGLGKSKTEDIIVTEMLEVIQGLREKNGQEVELSGEFNCAVANTIWSIAAGIRMSLDSTEMHDFLKLTQDFFMSFGDIAVLDAFPWLANILPKKWIHLDKFEAMRHKFFKFFQDEVDRHRLTFNPDEEDRDLIDSYLRRFKEEENNPGYDKELEEFNLLAILGDLFSAGGDTTYTAIRWCFLYLLKHPHEQKRIQELLDEVTGGNRMPSLADRASVPYVDAFIMEVFRHAVIAPMGVPHAATCDTTVMGYSIPKGTQIIPYFNACLQNPKYWGDPEVFRPGRFIDHDGNIIKFDAFIPFSTGRRSCPGEHLAKSELFLILSCLLQHFHFESVTGNPDDISLETENEAVLRYPKPYKMRVKSRKA